MFKSIYVDIGNTVDMEDMKLGQAGIIVTEDKDYCGMIVMRVNSPDSKYRVIGFKENDVAIWMWQFNGPDLKVALFPPGTKIIFETKG